MDERVLVWAPLCDGRLTCSFLTEEGFTCVHCQSWEALQAELRDGVAVLVIAGELLSANVLANLRELIASQPPWSDLPLTIVIGTEPVEDDRFAVLGNVSLLQRPSRSTRCIRRCARPYEREDANTRSETSCVSATKRIDGRMSFWPCSATSFAIHWRRYAPGWNS
jgi:hypothetical protein